MRRRRLASAAIVLLTLGASGCCSTPDTSRFFDRWDPLATLAGFVFAVENGDWDFACDCLSAADREQDVSCLELQLGINFVLEHPRYGIPIKDIIVDSKRLWTSREPRGIRFSPDGRQAVIELEFEGHTEDGIPIEFWLPVFLVNEAEGDGEPRWYISFEETIRNAP